MSTAFPGTSASIYNQDVTLMFNGQFFNSASIAVQTMTYSANTINVQTVQPHGLSVGNLIYITGTSASSNAPNGSWIISQVTSPTLFSFQLFISVFWLIKSIPKPANFPLLSAAWQAFKFTVIS
jgi:hypothetical protein